MVREVYDWATLTIGGARRALWLFLVPFLLLNTVVWLQPFALERRWATRAYLGATRLVGLTLTVLAVATCAEVAMDQLVRQCGSPGICDPANPAVRAVAGLGAGWGLVAAVAVPLTLALLLAAPAFGGGGERPTGWLLFAAMGGLGLLVV